MAKKGEVLAILQHLGLSYSADELPVWMKESIHIRTVPSPDADLPIGASKVGGLPDLPEATAWPQHNGELLSFLAQLDLAQVASAATTEHVLPESGLLSFFYDAINQPWGREPEDRDRWIVLYSPPEAPLVRTSPPPQMTSEIFNPCAVSLSSEITLHGSCDELLLDERLDEVYVDEQTEQFLVGMEFGGAAPKHRLLGAPDVLQTEMEPECENAFRGLRLKWNDPRHLELEAHSSDWRLLLQIDSDRNAGMSWGDAGRLYYWIRRQALDRHDFHDVWVILQSH